MAPIACPCGQALDLYDTEQHTHCPSCGRVIPPSKELRHVPTRPV